MRVLFVCASLVWITALPVGARAVQAKPKAVPIVDCKPDREDGCCSDEGMERLQSMAKGRRVMECDRVDRLHGFRQCGVAFQRRHDSLAEACLAGVMNTAIGTRLKTLHRDDPQQETTERALQKTWERELDHTCTAIEKTEPSAGRFPRAHQCRMDLTRWRAEQALRVAAGRMGLSDEVVPAGQTGQVQRFQPFVQGFCALPASVWRDKQSPSSCEPALLSEIQALLGRWAGGH